MDGGMDGCEGRNHLQLLRGFRHVLVKLDPHYSNKMFLRAALCSFRSSAEHDRDFLGIWRKIIFSTRGEEAIGIESWNRETITDAVKRRNKYRGNRPAEEEHLPPRESSCSWTL